MVFDHLHGGISIPLDCTGRICYAAFDGCSYYLLPCRECMIIKTGTDLQQECCFTTCRKYECLCYDLVQNCFWASGRVCGGRIYKLDNCMREIDHICLSEYCQPLYPITGLSCNCCTGKLVAASGDSLLEIDKKNGCCKTLYHCCEESITGVLSLCPGYLITSYNQGVQTLTVLGACNTPVKTCIISPEFSVRTVLFNPCSEDCPALECFVLKKECYSYMYRIPLGRFQLGYAPCQCNYRICKPCPPSPPPHPGHGCDDVLESIALVEASLAHILNAEGEKLQKVLAQSDDIEEILCVNRAVTQSVVKVTHLEQVLYDKLTALNTLCPPKNPCCSKNPCCPKEHCLP